jgi:membrane-associated HD superfamily phosphohydrolase
MILENIKIIIDVLIGNKPAGRLAVLPFLWIPIGAVGSILRNESENSFRIKFVIFVIIYLIFTIVLCLIFNKIIASKQLKLSNKRSYLYLSIIVLQFFLLMIPYLVQILVSWESLFLTVPISLVITLICTIMMIKENEKLVEKK